MKERVSFVVMIILGFLAPVALFGMGRVPEPNVLTINDVQADPAAYKGEITLSGIVAHVGEEGPKSFALIDTREAKLCKSITCAKFYLTIKTDGSLPKEWDEVIATGTFIEKGKVFQASAIKIVDQLEH